MLILLTATINVENDVPFVKIRNKEERLREYLESVSFYLEARNIDKVVVCENSLYKGTEFAIFYELAKSKGKEFEYLTFKSDSQNVICHGKGYGEGEIIKYALKNSILLKEEDFFVKITGRVKIDNISVIAKKINKKKIYMMQLNKEVPEVFSVIFAIDKKVYADKFLDEYTRVQDREKYYLEHVFYDTLKKNNLRSYCFARFPQVNGISGSSGKAYIRDEKKFDRIKHDTFCCLFNKYGVK